MLRIEPELDLVVGDLRHLLRLQELLLHLPAPAERLKDADRPLRLEQALRERGQHLLVGAPRSARRERGDAGARAVEEGAPVERKLRTHVDVSGHRGEANGGVFPSPLSLSALEVSALTASPFSSSGFGVSALTASPLLPSEPPASSSRSFSRASPFCAI